MAFSRAPRYRRLMQIARAAPQRYLAIATCTGSSRDDNCAPPFSPRAFQPPLDEEPLSTLEDRLVFT